jgi:CrcB protein
MQVVLVAVGSSLGGLLRWGVAIAAARWIGTALPYGTFVINVTGSLFVGWFLTVLAERFASAERTWLTPNDLRLFLAVGFAGSYTTFSTFEWESYGLLRNGNGLASTAYMLGSLLAGLLAIQLGVHLARSP